MVFVIGEILSYHSLFGFYNDKVEFANQPGREYQKITKWVFTKLNQLIKDLLDGPFPNSNIEEIGILLKSRKELVRTMLLILQQVDRSTFEIEIYIARRRKISTRSYIHTMENYINGIVADSLVGAVEIKLSIKANGRKVFWSNSHRATLSRESSGPFTFVALLFLPNFRP
jgi:hypothetical protein